ncbi:MAG TPA: class I SAM-dependent RNA methyltransferase [Lactobacillaceae bacterium]|jgi:putative N6-adenine-specific DNA methylase
MTTYKLMATAASGIEALVAKELQQLGFQTQTENGRVLFEADQAGILRANLWLRTAGKVKIIVGEFEANTLDDLFEGVKALEWERFLNYDTNFWIARPSIRKSERLNSEPTIQGLTERAIVDHLKDYFHFRGSLPKAGYDAPIEILVEKGHITLLLDTTGESLFKRGYRVNKGGAPLKENFAAALVMLTNWRPDMPFVDPTSGSGTIAIEAALIGRNLAPGLNRKFVIEDMDWFDATLSDTLRDEAEDKADYDRELEIYGFDIDETMVAIAQENARHAGLSQDITFKQLAAKDWQTDLPNGVLVSNPPYGERLGELDAARELYAQMGEVYRQLPGWSKYILTSDLEFEQAYGAKATKKRKLYNGALRVDLFQFWARRD